MDFTGEIVTLRIDSTWNGEPIGSDEEASIALGASADRDLVVRVDAPFHADPPPPGPPGPTPGLWNFEVVELFVAESAPDDVAATTTDVRYLEVELSPHGHHLVLELRGVRQVTRQGLALDFTARIDAVTRRWTGVAVLPRVWLPPSPHRVNAFAIHGRADARRHLARTPLPGPEPDFHQPGRFPVVDLGLGYPK